MQSPEQRLNEFLAKMEKRFLTWRYEWHLTPETPCPKCNEVHWNVRLNSNILRTDVILLRLESIYGTYIICNNCGHRVSNRRGIRNYARIEFARYREWVDERDKNRRKARYQMQEEQGRV